MIFSPSAAIRCILGFRKILSIERRDFMFLIRLISSTTVSFALKLRHLVLYGLSRINQANMQPRYYRTQF